MVSQLRVNNIESLSGDTLWDSELGIQGSVDVTEGLTPISSALNRRTTNFESVDEMESSSTPVGALVAALNQAFQKEASGWLPLQTINIEAYGVRPDGDPATNYAGIMKALEDNAGKARILWPRKYPVSRTIVFPSYTHIVGIHRNVSGLTMPSDVRRGECVAITGYRGQHNHHIVIDDWQADFNEDRWSDTDGESEFTEMNPTGESWERNVTVSGTALMICNSSYVVLNRVDGWSGHRHSIDISAPWDGLGETSPNNYDPEPSHHISLNDVRGYRAGDDCVTFHQCHDVWCSEVFGEDSSGVRVSGNSNGVEIDDGCRNIYFLSGGSKRCDFGLQIKGHETGPAPYNIYVGVFTSINDRQGLEIRHTSYYSSSDESPEARNIRIDAMNIIAPRELMRPSGMISADVGAQIRSYDGVSIGHLYITDGESDNARTIDDYLPSTTLSGNVVVFANSNIRSLNIDQLTIDGFSNTATHGFRSTGTRGAGMRIGNFTCKNGPKAPWLVTGSGSVQLLSHDVSGDWTSASDSVGIETTIDTSTYVGPGTVSGYTALYKRNGEDSFDYPAELHGGIGVFFRGAEFEASTLTSAPIIARRGSTGWIFDVEYSGVRHAGLHLSSSTTRFCATNGNTMSFATSKDNSDDFPSSRWEIATPSTHAFIPSTNNTYDIGAGSRQVKDIYLANSPIVSSDNRLKTDVRNVSEAESRVAKRLAADGKFYKFISSVESKGDEARWHYGWIAQEVVKAFEDEGLDAFSYSICCYNTWEGQPEVWEDVAEVKDESGNVIQEATKVKTQEYQPAGDQFSLKMEQLLAFIVCNK